MRRRHERGTALGALLVVLMLVAVLSVGLFRMAALRLARAQQAAYRLQAQYAAETGIEYVRWKLSQPGGLRPLLTPQPAFTLTDTLGAAAGYRVRVRPYGGYIEAVATGRCYREHVGVRVLLGMRPPSWFRRAVTLRPSSYPLVLAGKSRIRGDVLAGPGGVRTGRLPGTPPPPGTPRVEGRILRQGQGAAFDAYLFRATMAMLDHRLEEEGDSPLDAFGERLTPRAFPDSLRGGVIHLRGALVQLTAGPEDAPLYGPLTLVARGELRLEGDLKLRGALTLVARDSIRVSDRVDIRGGLLYCPGPIRLTGEMQLSGQAISRRRIVVTENARVRYPGVLFATGALSHGRREGGITIASTRRQSGSFLVQEYADLMTTAPDRTLVAIAPGGRVAGLVYSANYTRLEGRMLGAVATGAFYLQRGPTTYINWIHDGAIDRSALGPAFRLPLLFGARLRLEPVAWQWQKP